MPHDLHTTRGNLILESERPLENINELGDPCIKVSVNKSKITMCMVMVHAIYFSYEDNNHNHFETLNKYPHTYTTEDGVSTIKLFGLSTNQR